MLVFEQFQMNCLQCPVCQCSEHESNGADTDLPWLVRTRPCCRALLLWGSFQHAFKCKHEAILDILDFLKCGCILLLALVAVLQRSLLKNTSATIQTENPWDLLEKQ